jgi:hypothetical protein
MIFRIHLAIIASFVAMPLVVDAASSSTAIRIDMCGPDHATVSIEVPIAPQPAHQNPCHKACHAGCLRKRRADRATAD